MTVKNSSVLWSVQQDLSNAQKSQGRSNIDAVTAKKTTTSLPPTDTKIDTLQVFTDGRVRGDSTDLGCLTPNITQADTGKVLTANWISSPSRGFATWEDAPQSTAWGINTDTTVQFTNQPDDEYADPNPAINVVGIQNFKNNIVDIAVPPITQYKFCDNDILRINPPIIANPQEAYGYNFWVRLSIHNAINYGVSRTSFTIEIPNVGWDIDQYWLEESPYDVSLTTFRYSLRDNFESNTTSTTVICPTYGYTNYYMIKVSGDMAKLRKFQPPAV